MKNFLNKAKGKLGLELILLGIAPAAGIATSAQTYQEPPAIVQQASQEKQAPSASYSQQDAGQADDVGVFIPLYYDQLTGSPKIYFLNAKRIYRLKIMEGDTITKYVKSEEWPDMISPSDSLIGVMYTALNGKRANVNTLIEGEYVLLEDVDGNDEVLNRKGDKLPSEDIVKVVNSNVYSRGKK